MQPATASALVIACLSVMMIRFVRAQPCIECRYCSTDNCFTQCEKSCAITSTPPIFNPTPTQSPASMPSPPTVQPPSPATPTPAPVSPTPAPVSPTPAPVSPTPAPVSPTPTPEPSPSLPPPTPAPPVSPQPSPSTPSVPPPPPPSPTPNPAPVQSPTAALPDCKGFGRIAAAAIMQPACDAALRYCEGMYEQYMTVAAAATPIYVSLDQCEKIAYGVCQQTAFDSNSSPCGYAFGGVETCSAEAFMQFYEGEVNELCEVQVKDIA